MNLSVRNLAILPDKDIELTLHQLSMKTSLDFVILSLFNIKNIKKKGMQVPGPFEIK